MEKEGEGKGGKKYSFQSNLVKYRMKRIDPFIFDITYDIINSQKTEEEMPERICRLLEQVIFNIKNVKFKDIDKLLRELGYEKRQPRKGSSHYVYRKQGENPITIPFKKPFIKATYVKMLIKQLNLEGLYEETCKKEP